jgi:DNA-binding Xre family transcriptional regulator
MGMSYKKLWKLLIDRDMIKKDLREGSGLSTASMAKLYRNKNVNTDVLVSVCYFLKCDISDICEIVPPSDDYNEKQSDSKVDTTNSRRLTQKEFDEIAVLSRKCIDAYSSRSVVSEVRRLKLLANTLDVDPQIKNILVELANYSQEASKQKPHNVKDHWVNLALGALGKLEQNDTDLE